MNKDRKVILSIETSFEGGSISILNEGIEIDFWTGAKDVSKAEDVLAEIAKILNRNKIDKKHIKLITVSNEFGSSTGVKIGLAIARGLGMALGCEVFEKSILEALSKNASGDNKGETVIILPDGKDLFFLHQVNYFDSKINIKNIKTANYKKEEFIAQLKLIKNSRIIFYQKNFESYGHLFTGNIDSSNKIILSDQIFATLIAKAVESEMGLIML